MSRRIHFKNSARKPRSLSVKVSPGILPDAFASHSVKLSMRSVELVASHKFCPVVLSGLQLLLVERALLRESDALKERLEAHEFDVVVRSCISEELNTLHTALRVLKQAVSTKNREQGNMLTQKNGGKL